ncbi:hypothetical protein L6452_19198 [Arctium lappa]|uniref:Uncharacterized protein n=1 Tax=Arctium lappa TaxID=4217 RepID=A0ACB9B8A9_ARCLA|nr:hypothetical protein L6452_19198 [Arctium lappa]
MSDYERRFVRDKTRPRAEVLYDDPITKINKISEKTFAYNKIIYRHYVVTRADQKTYEFNDNDLAYVKHRAKRDFQIALNLGEEKLEVTKPVESFDKLEEQKTGSIVAEPLGFVYRVNQVKKIFLASEVSKYSDETLRGIKKMIHVKEERHRADLLAKLDIEIDSMINFRALIMNPTSEDFQRQTSEDEDSRGQRLQRINLPLKYLSKIATFREDIRDSFIRGSEDNIRSGIQQNPNESQNSEKTISVGQASSSSTSVPSATSEQAVTNQRNDQNDNTDDNMGHSFGFLENVSLHQSLGSTARDLDLEGVDSTIRNIISDSEVIRQEEGVLVENSENVRIRVNEEKEHGERECIQTYHSRRAATSTTSPHVLRARGIETRTQFPPSLTSFSAPLSLEPIVTSIFIPRTQPNISATIGSLSAPIGTSVVDPHSGLRGSGGSPIIANTMPALSTGHTVVSSTAVLTGSLSSPGVSLPEFVSREFLNGALKVIENSLSQKFQSEMSKETEKFEEEIGKVMRMLKGKNPIVEEPEQTVPQPTVQSVFELKSLLLAQLLSEAPADQTEADLIGLLRQQSQPIVPQVPVDYVTQSQFNQIKDSVEKHLHDLTTAVQLSCKAQSDAVLKKRHDCDSDQDHEGEMNKRQKTAEDTVIVTVEEKGTEVTETTHGDQSEKEQLEENVPEAEVELMIYDNTESRVEKPAIATIEEVMEMLGVTAENFVNLDDYESDDDEQAAARYDSYWRVKQEGMDVIEHIIQSDGPDPENTVTVEEFVQNAISQGNLSQSENVLDDLFGENLDENFDDLEGEDEEIVDLDQMFLVQQAEVVEVSQITSTVDYVPPNYRLFDEDEILTAIPIVSPTRNFSVPENLDASEPRVALPLPKDFDSEQPVDQPKQKPKADKPRKSKRSRIPTPKPKPKDLEEESPIIIDIQDFRNKLYKERKQREKEERQIIREARAELRKEEEEAARAKASALPYIRNPDSPKILSKAETSLQLKPNPVFATPMEVEEFSKLMIQNLNQCKQKSSSLMKSVI